jgi:hypothetical protein
MLLSVTRSEILPKTLRRRPAGVRTLLVFLLAGSGIAYGAGNPCRDQGALFGAMVALTGGLGCAAFRDKPGRLAQAWRRFGDRVNPLFLRAYCAGAPYAWRWGVLCAGAGLLGLLRGFRDPGCS